MTFDEIKKIPGVTAFTGAVPKEGWPECGLTIYGIGPSPNVAICCAYNYSDIREATFTSFTKSQFHYCPTATWDEWVQLAKQIIKIDSLDREAHEEEGRAA